MHPTFDTGLHKILNDTGDMCDETCCHKVIYFTGELLLITN